MEKRLERFEHGGDVYAHAGAIDFSANVNPLGMPPEAVQALRDNIGAFEAYPDVAYRDLRRAIAHAEGVPERFIVCTAGVTDLLHRICDTLQFGTALVTAPCFSGYEQALERANTTIVRHALEEGDGFELTNAIQGFSEGADAPDAVFLCNPNNPTGLTIDADLLSRVLDEARAANIYVVLDECFLDFTHEPSAVPSCEEYPNLIIMRAFTKMYAMAGLRLGYGICSDTALVDHLDKAGQLWAVSTPAQVAGVAALEADGWLDRTRAYVDEQRAVLTQGLCALGLSVVPGKANYLMFKSEQPLYEPLLAKGFLIRRCENYVGLDGRWYRIAVRTAEENEAFLEALRETLL